ncbi:transposase [Rhizobium tibeticum]|uniref:transposase n=1 Tax=Rhizobium tibeticum TaxID=501024 RepID=UPI000ACCBC19|nr:transposase [Rhizobium tibeticum]
MFEAIAAGLGGAPREIQRWSDEFKAQAVAESMEPGAMVHAGSDVNPDLGKILRAVRKA